MPRFPSNPKVWLSNSSWTGSIRVVFLYRRAHPNFPLPLRVRTTAPMANTLLQCGSRKKDRETRKGRGGVRRWSRELCHLSSVLSLIRIWSPRSTREQARGVSKVFGLLYTSDWRIFKVLNCFVTKLIKILESQAKTTFFSYFKNGNNVAHTVHCNSASQLSGTLVQIDVIISSSLNNTRHMF